MNIDSLKIGDTLYFEHGCMVGRGTGHVIGFERTAFGMLAWVRMHHFGLTCLDSVNGTVTGAWHHVEGEDYFSARGDKIGKIGAYIVRNP